MKKSVYILAMLFSTITFPQSTSSVISYHKPTDTVENIEFELMTARTKLVFYTAWEIVNREGRLIVD